MSLLLSGCATVYNPATQRKEVILINDATEVSLGRNVAAELAKKQKIYRDAADLGRVRWMGRRIALVCDRTNIPYEFNVIDDPELNALSLPGGFVYINKGLLDKLNDDERAFGLWHEVGHVAAKHAVKKVQSGMAFQLIIALALAGAGGKNQEAASSIADASGTVYNLISLGYSRQDEYFADKLGVRYAWRAGFAPGSAITALEKIKQAEQPNKILGYLRTHPYIEDRIRALRTEIPQIK